MSLYRKSAIASATPATRTDHADTGRHRSVFPWIFPTRPGPIDGFRDKYLNAYLNEFAFRWNRRHSYRSAFERLVGIGIAMTPATCADIRATAA